MGKSDHCRRTIPARLRSSRGGFPAGVMSVCALRMHLVPSRIHQTNQHLGATLVLCDIVTGSPGLLLSDRPGRAALFGDAPDTFGTRRAVPRRTARKKDEHQFRNRRFICRQALSEILLSAATEEVGPMQCRDALKGAALRIGSAKTVEAIVAPLRQWLRPPQRYRRLRPVRQRRGLRW
jgi:hypothetical protein